MWPSSASGAGGFGNFALPTSPAVGDKRPGGATGGSRLAHLIPKDNAEGTGPSKSSEAQSPLAQQSWRTRPRTDTDPFGGDEELSGSAVLGGAQDTSSGGPQPPSRAGVLGTPVKGSAGDFGMSGLNLGGQSSGDNGPVSPSETNPYRSPPAERHDHDGQDSSAGDKIHSTGHEQQPHSNYSTLSRGFAAAFDGSDRSQTSSVGAKAFLSGGWPAPAGPSAGTPDRERSNFGGAFGSSLFSPIGDLQSPGLGNLGGVFGPSNTGSIGRGSKLGSLFPPAMQAQMQAHEQESNLSDSLGDLRQSNPLGAIGRSNFAVPTRDTDSPMRSNRGVFEELFPSSDSSRNLAAFVSSDAGQPNIAATVPQSFTPVSGGLPFGNAQGGVEHPSAQVRQMVMPDRMRWVYLDPQGQIQGPFTGLEMNDWYKANFFTPDLRVKKVEDPEFEPLGQLIRRIGNSREPFLVPQIGIAHGPPMQNGPFGPGTGSGIIPPLSGVFPTFGRTLTAEEQNNLERRKQEEQFLMAQQRDFMMRQQAMAKFQMQPSLQHHSSAHSLQSQPSFGSITSPLGVPQQQHHQLPHQQPIGAMGGPGGVFDSHPSVNPAAIRAAMGNGELFRPEDLANLSTNERQMLASLQGEPTGTESGAPQPIGTLSDASLRYGLPEANELKEDDEGFKDRLQEFEELRAEHDAAQAAGIPVDESQESFVKVEETTVTTVTVEPKSEPAPSAGKASKASKKKTTVVEESSLSLTQQVRKTQASAAAAATVPPPPQPTELGMPMPFPPPASTTPLPAPTAQRARSNLPEQFSRSQTATPDVVAQPPPLAPWAKEPGQEGQKGPSLKEIQEAEARKAAKAEEAAAALRKAAMEQEAALLREKEKSAAAAAVNAGLPATSTWGQGSPVSSVSPWAKPGAAKAKGATPIAATGAAGAKKTLAEIQREEEARKQKAKEVTTQTGGGAPISIGKSYANLAGKPNHGPSPTVPSPIITAGSGWATVGAGGKVKSPSTVPSQLQSRSGSASSAKPAAVATPVKLAPKSIISNTISQPANAAMDEFNKWAYRELSRGITGVSDSKSSLDIPTITFMVSNMHAIVTSFQADLAVLPLDTGLIADAVYANSTTMDGRHFAEEYVRRKRLAEKGVVEKQTQAESKASSSAGGWNEVAKKSGAAQARESDAMQSADFKVVPGRKKSKK